MYSLYLIYNFWFVSTGLRLIGVLLKSFWSFSRLRPLYVTWGLRRDTHHTAELLSCLWGKTAICLISLIYRWGRVKRFHFYSLISITFLLIMMQSIKTCKYPCCCWFFSPNLCYIQAWSFINIIPNSFKLYSLFSYWLDMFLKSSK